MDNLKYLKLIVLQFLTLNWIEVSQRAAIAALISYSDFPAATAFSIRASEIAELPPGKAIKSAVNGTPSLAAISFTFSWLAFYSAAAVDVVEVADFV